MAINNNYAAEVGIAFNEVKLQSQLKRLASKTITVDMKLSGGTTTQINGINKALNKMKETTSVAVSEINNLDKTANVSMRNLNKSVKSTTETIQTASKHTATLGEKFVDVTKKVVAFGAVTSIIGLFTKAIMDAIQVVREFDKVQTDYMKVSDLSGESLDEYTKKLGELGSEVARTSTEMLASATKFKQSGFTDEESANLAKVAELYRNVADGQIDSATASSFVISQMKAFNITAEDAISIIDKLNIISNNFSVSSSDVAMGLTKSSASLSAYGNSISETMALVTAGVEIMTGQAGRVARGLSSVGAEIVKLANDSGKLEYSMGGATKSISLFNEETGDMKNTYEVLSEVAKGWEEMSNAEQASIALTLGSKTQIAVVSSVLSNFNTAIDANTMALQAQGSAYQENQKYLESLEARTNLLKAEFEKLVLGEGGLQDFMKTLTSMGVTLLKFANSDVGRAIIQMTALTGAFTLLNGIIKSTTMINMVGWFKGIFEALVLVKNGTIGWGLALRALNLNPVILAISAIIVGGTALVKVVDAVTTSFEEQVAIVDELVTKMDSLKTEKEKLLEIDSDDRTKDQVRRLQLLELEIQANDKLLKQEQQREYDKDLRFAGADIKSGGIDYSQEDDYLFQQIEEYKKLQQELGQMDYEDENNIKKIKKKEEQLEKLKFRFIDLAGAMQDYIDDGVDVEEVDESNLKLMYEILGVTGELTNKKQEALELSEEEIAQLEAIAKALAENLEQYSLTNVSLTDISDAYQTVIDSAKEYNENGYITLETYEKLMSLGAEYYNLLFDENGQLQLNAETLNNVTKAKIDEMAISQARAMLETADAYYAENGTLEGLTETLRETTLATWDDVEATLASYEANGENTDALRKRINTLKLWADEAKRGVGVETKSIEKTKDKTKAIDKQKEALDKLKDEYKAVTEYIEDQLESEISRIEDAKDAELDRIDSTIDALNKRKDAELESIDFTLDALNKKRDVEEEYWDNRISALEAQNKATEEQIELEQLQENLALARNKKVMVMGANGWEVRSDESAIAQAEQDISNYNRRRQAQVEIDILNQLKSEAMASYTTQIQAHEDFRAQQEVNYDAQIQAQEDFKTKQESAFDAQIQVLEGYKTEYNNMINAYEEEQNRLLALQVLGTDFEAQTWQTRLANLQSYVNRYNTLQASLSGSVANTSSGGETPVKTSSSVPKAKVVAKVTGVKSLGSKTRAYASGVSSVRDDEVAMVGDNPNNRELVIGGKLNGTATKLTSGSGVVNADAMKTWAGIMNNLGSNNLMSKAMGGNITNSNMTNDKTIINNFNVTANVQDGKDFTRYMSTFSRDMLQKAYT